MTKSNDDVIQRIEKLVSQLAQIPDDRARKTAEQLMESILALHGSGLERIMEILAESEEAEAISKRMVSDSLVSNLLILHGLHPDNMETRVRQALAGLPYSAELLGIFDGIVRIRLTGGGCRGKESVMALLQEAVPDAREIVVEENTDLNGFVPLAVLSNPVSTAG